MNEAILCAAHLHNDADWHPAEAIYEAAFRFSVDPIALMGVMFSGALGNTVPLKELLEVARHIGRIDAARVFSPEPRVGLLIQLDGEEYEIVGERRLNWILQDVDGLKIVRSYTTVRWAMWQAAVETMKA